MAPSILMRRTYTLSRARTAGPFRSHGTAGRIAPTPLPYLGSARAAIFHLATRGAFMGGGCRGRNNDLVSAVALEAA